MNELKTEPGWKPSPARGRPWWAVAMAGGFGAILAVLFSLGLLHGPAQAEAQTPVRASGVVQTLPPGSISLDERLRNIESTLNSQSLTLNAVVTELAEVKSLLPPKKR